MHSSSAQTARDCPRPRRRSLAASGAGFAFLAVLAGAPAAFAAHTPVELGTAKAYAVLADAMQPTIDELMRDR